MTAVAFAPSVAGGQGSALRLVSAAADRCARVWDCRACKCLRAARGLPADPSAAAIARRGSCACYWLGLVKLSPRFGGLCVWSALDVPLWCRSGALAVLGDTQGNVLTWSLDLVGSKPARLGTALGSAVVSLAVSPSAGTQVMPCCAAVHALCIPDICAVNGEL